MITKIKNYFQAKKILIVRVNTRLELSLNWFEYLVVRKVLKQRRFQFIDSETTLRGRHYNHLIIDEMANLSNEMLETLATRTFDTKDLNSSYACKSVIGKQK